MIRVAAVSSGDRYGKLTVVDRLPERGNGVKYRFTCDCGAQVDRYIGQVRAGVRKGDRPACKGCVLAERAQRCRRRSRSQEEALQAFLGRLDKSAGDDGCWPFTGSRNRDGYGSWRSKGGRYIGAHRYTYENLVAPIPDGLHVLHECDNPPCCNPKHLKLGTPADNANDKVVRGRARAVPRHGSENAGAKLDEGTVWVLRALFDGGVSQSVIADVTSINRTTVDFVVHRKTWKHVA